MALAVVGDIEVEVVGLWAVVEVVAVDITAVVVEVVVEVVVVVQVVVY